MGLLTVAVPIATSRPDLLRLLVVLASGLSILQTIHPSFPAIPILSSPAIGILSSIPDRRANDLPRHCNQNIPSRMVGTHIVVVHEEPKLDLPDDCDRDTVSQLFSSSTLVTLEELRWV